MASKVKIGENMKKFSINLLEEKAKYLDYVAQEVGKTRGELVREILEKEVMKYKSIFGDAFKR